MTDCDCKGHPIVSFEGFGFTIIAILLILLLILLLFVNWNEVAFSWCIERAPFEQCEQRYSERTTDDATG